MLLAQTASPAIIPMDSASLATLDPESRSMELVLLVQLPPSPMELLLAKTALTAQLVTL